MWAIGYRHHKGRTPTHGHEPTREARMSLILLNVRNRGQPGKHLLAVSFSRFDPLRTFVVRCPTQIAQHRAERIATGQRLAYSGLPHPLNELLRGVGRAITVRRPGSLLSGRLSRRPADVIPRGAFRKASVWTALFGSAHTGVTVRWVTSHRTTGCHAACFIHIPDFLAERP
jgi:hypothetical protein